MLQVLSTSRNLRRLMMGNTNITGTIPCRLFEEHELKTLMFSVNKLEGDMPECMLAVSIVLQQPASVSSCTISLDPHAKPVSLF